VSGINTLSSGVEQLDPPANGMAQFKGLTASTDEKKYVKVICVGVAPSFSAWQAALTAGGFIVNCYTGIPQCQSSLADGYTFLDTSLTATFVASCMADPRYLTWRSFVVRVSYAGVVTWFRVDSYWNSAAKQAASTWGPGIHLSTSLISSDDNMGTTGQGLTFCFAYSDGSGVQLNHITTCDCGTSNDCQ